MFCLKLFDCCVCDTETRYEIAESYLEHSRKYSDYDSRVKAMKIFKDLADQNHVNAAYQYGKNVAMPFLCNGSVGQIPGNPLIAKVYLRKAISLGHSEAQGELETVEYWDKVFEEQRVAGEALLKKMSVDIENRKKEEKERLEKEKEEKRLQQEKLDRENPTLPLLRKQTEQNAQIIQQQQEILKKLKEGVTAYPVGGY